MKAPLNLQVIKSLSGKPEFVLIPVSIYQALREQIEDEIAGLEAAGNIGGYVSFALEDYLDNPIALARVKADLTQQELAARLSVSQAYISKVEQQKKVTPRLLSKVTAAIGKKSTLRKAKQKGPTFR